MPDIGNLAFNTALNAKVNEFKNEVLDITNLAVNNALTVTENKVPNVNNLVKKADYNAEIKDVKDKYFTTSEYNKFMNNILDAKIKTKKIANGSSLNEKIKTLKAKEEIKTLATKAELKQSKIK